LKEESGEEESPQLAVPAAGQNCEIMLLGPFKPDNSLFPSSSSSSLSLSLLNPHQLSTLFTCYSNLHLSS